MGEFVAKLKARRMVVRIVPASENPPTPTVPDGCIEVDPKTVKTIEVINIRPETLADVLHATKITNEYARKFGHRMAPGMQNRIIRNPHVKKPAD